MAGQLVDFTEHHFPPCSACDHPLPSPYTHTHTNNSLTFTSLPDGDSAAKIRKTPLIKDNSNVITDKAAQAGLQGSGSDSSRRDLHSPISHEKVTLKDKMGVG